jgi:type I restriction enzyme M protein
MDEIEANDFNLNISRYISTAEPEAIIDLAEVHKDLVAVEQEIRSATRKHNRYLAELGLALLPEADDDGGSDDGK